MSLRMRMILRRIKPVERDPDVADVNRQVEKIHQSLDVLNDEARRITAEVDVMGEKLADSTARVKDLEKSQPRRKRRRRRA